MPIEKVMETRSTLRMPDGENERPFYELDDEELILAEATDAALSDARPRRGPAAVNTAPPGIVLRALVDTGTVERLFTLANQVPTFSILEHAQIVNACACTVDRMGTDRFGISALLRHENGLLQLDRIAPGESPRTINGLRPEEIIDSLCTSPPSDRNAAPAGLARRLSSGELLALAPLAHEENRFMAMRRFSLGLLPTLSSNEVTAEVLRDYVFALRIFINGLAARWSLLTWPELRAYYAEDADAAARAFLKALKNEING